MLWLRGVTIIADIVVICLVGVLVASLMGHLDWALVCFFVALILGVYVVLRVRQLKDKEIQYGCVKFFCLQESPNAWSTHIGGFIERPLYQVRCSVKNRIIGKPKAYAGLRLVLQSEAREKVRQLSFECFTGKLDELTKVENAVLITASILNDPARKSRRLEERIKAINDRPDWCYRLIERKVSFFDTFSICFYGWRPSLNNGIWCPWVPGLIAWRKVDEQPNLRRFNARPMQTDQISTDIDRLKQCREI